MIFDDEGTYVSFESTSCSCLYWYWPTGPGYSTVFFYSQIFYVFDQLLFQFQGLINYIRSWYSKLSLELILWLSGSNFVDTYMPL